MKKTSKSILIVSPFFPYPTFFGGAYDIWEKIKGLHSLGYNIDLIYTYKDYPKKSDIEYIKKYVENIIPIHRKNKLIHLLNGNPLQAVSRRKLKDAKFNKHYHLVLLESEYVGYILDNKTLKYKHKVIRVHNDESLYFNNLKDSTNNYFKKLYYIIESKKFYKYSFQIFKKMDRLWFISSDEKHVKEKQLGKANTIHLPPPINQEYKKRKLENNNVLFIGSLFMENNIEAIQWYLDNVHDSVCTSIQDYKLIICGSTGGNSEDYFIKKFSKIKNVVLYFNLESLEQAYSSASLFINPMKHGSGVKLKSINSLVNGLPLVATTIGSEGMDFVDKEMFYLANSPKEFSNKVIEALKETDKQRTVSNAQNYLKSINYLDTLKKELNTLK